MLGKRLKCPKCGSIVGYRMVGLNLFPRRLQKCSSCGKLVLMRYASKADAEEKRVEEPSEEEKVKKRIEENIITRWK